MFYPFTIFFIFCFSVSRQRSICSSTDTSMRWPSNSPQSRPTQPLQVRRADHQAAKRPTASGLFPGSLLDKNITSQTKVQSQGKLCVCFSDYATSVFTACLHLMLKYDIFSWRNDFEASSYLGKFGACWNEFRQEEYLEIYLSLS